MDEPGAHDVVGGRVVTQLARQDAGGVLLLHQRVTVDNLECVLVYDQHGEYLQYNICKCPHKYIYYLTPNLLFLAILCLSCCLATPHEAAEATAGAGGGRLCAGAGSAGLEARLAVYIVPGQAHC